MDNFRIDHDGDQADSQLAAGLAGSEWRRLGARKGPLLPEQLFAALLGNGG